MSIPKVLIQLDGDSQASVFDAVVAFDSEVDQLLQYRDVEPAQVRSLVHGAMFTRGQHDLRNTAVFVGGCDVARGESLLKEVTSSFLGPLRVSVMMDANGANTTAAAAVLAAARHVPLERATVVVLGGTGPVGQRVVRLLARRQAKVRICSRSLGRAEAVRDGVREVVPDCHLTAVQTGDEHEIAVVLEGADIVICAGAAGVVLLPQSVRSRCPNLRVAIDLNAVPPLGVEGTEVTDKAAVRDGVVCYGAVGVGGTKMNIHKRAIRRLFDSNDQVLDAEEILEIGQSLED